MHALNVKCSCYKTLCAYKAKMEEGCATGAKFFHIVEHLQSLGVTLVFFNLEHIFPYF